MFFILEASWATFGRFFGPLGTHLAPISEQLGCTFASLHLNVPPIFPIIPARRNARSDPPPFWNGGLGVLDENSASELLPRTPSQIFPEFCRSCTSPKSSPPACAFRRAGPSQHPLSTLFLSFWHLFFDLVFFILSLFWAGFGVPKSSQNQQKSEQCGFPIQLCVCIVFL